MATYNLSVTFALSPMLEASSSETVFSQGFITIVSIENQYQIKLVEVRGGNE
jgi:hypothetical protein